MPTAAYTAQLEAFSKIPTLLVKLTVQGDLSGSPTQVFRFSPKEGKALSLQLTEDVRPYLLGDVRGRPTRIRPDASITERHSVTLRMIDDPNAPAFDSSVFSVTTGGSFFRRLKVAAVSVVGSKIEILRGFVASPFPESDFETIFKGRVEDINFAKDQTVQIVAKDHLALIDKRMPSQISDDNLLDGSISTATLNIDVDKGSEITDPSTLDSKDLFPVIIRIEPGTANEEDIIIEKRTGNTLRVQANFLDFSEDFTDSLWTKSGVTVISNEAFGPFGGDFLGDKLSFAAAGDLIQQIALGALTPGQIHVFSVWMKTTGAASGTIVLRVEDAGATESSDNRVTVTNLWQRFDIVFTFSVGASGNAIVSIVRDLAGDLTDLIAFGAQHEIGESFRSFYVSTTTNGGPQAGRGAFGTTNVSHADNVEFREVLIYRNQLSETGINPVVIARDFINRGGVEVVDVNETCFGNEFDFSEKIAFRRGKSTGNPDTTIDKSTNLLRLMKEVREQSLLDIFVDDNGQICARYSWRGNLANETSFQADDETNIMEDSLEIKNNSDSRFTRIYVYFKLKVDTDGEFRSGDRPDDFENVEAFVDFAVEDVPGARVKPIFSKWIFRAEEAKTAASRFLSRFRKPARILRFDVDVKDDSDIVLGRIIQINSDDLLTVGSGSADRADVNFQVVQKIDKRNQGIVSIECMEHRGLRFGLIAPAGFPDYDAATGFTHLGHADRLHGFIGRASDNKVGTALDEGYVVQ